MRRRCIRIFQQGVVLCQNVQSIQVLPLVFVQTLYLSIENAVGIQNQTALFLDILGETLLVFLLDFPQPFQNGLVVCENVQLFQLAAVFQEAVADLVTQQLGLRFAIPLVTFLNLFGVSRYSSWNTLSLMISECSLETPLTL